MHFSMTGQEKCDL